MKETYPLKWPEGWTRTLPEKQRAQSQWKKPHGFYVDALENELKRMGMISAVLTLNTRGDRDPGVAVWFSRKKEEDFSWRGDLGITIAYPTLDDIDKAYYSLSKLYHPDTGASADSTIFHRITDARAKAKRWVNRQEGNTFDYSIGADAFREARLNIAALSNSVRYLRGLERCGTSQIMEKTFEGFKQIAEQAVSHVAAAS
jgi:hypothetical protein